jgi:hypothetical protein
MVFYVSIRSLDEQFADYSCIAIADSHHEWSISLVILGIQCGQVLTGE